MPYHQDGIRKVGPVHLSHYSGGPLLGDFFGDSGFLSGGSRSGFILNVEESPVALSICQEKAWAGHTEGCKMVASLHFSALLL